MPACRSLIGISYALAEAMSEGHSGLPVEELTALAARLPDVSDELIATALDLELEAGVVVADRLEGRQCVFLAGLDCRMLAGTRRWHTALATYRRGQGPPLGRASDRPDACREPAQGGHHRPFQQGVRPALLRFYTVRSRVRGWFWRNAKVSLRNVRFMAC